MHRGLRIPRIYVDLPLECGAEIVLPPEAVRHLRRVLRMPSGAALRLFNGAGGEFEAVLALEGRRGGRARVGAHREVATEPALEIGLAPGLPRGGRMDYTIQKAVELGVSWIQPLTTERGTVQLDPERARRRRRHWQGIVAGACAQCGRALLPPVHDPLPLCEWLERLPGRTDRIVATPGAAPGLAVVPRPRAALAILIGPEGGLAPREVAAARRRGFRAVSFGPRTLRAETAALVALSAAQVLWGDLGRDRGG